MGDVQEMSEHLKVYALFIIAPDQLPLETFWLFWLCALPSSALAMYVLAFVPVKRCWG